MVGYDGGLRGGRYLRHGIVQLPFAQPDMGNRLARAARVLGGADGVCDVF